MTLAVVPAKDLNGAKARLADLVTPDERRILALAMLEDVLAALVEVPRLDGILVVTCQAEIAALARELKAEVLEEPENRGHTAAVAYATQEVLARGGSALLTVPGDLPAISPGEVEAMLNTLGPSPSAVLVPSRDGQGTNGVLLAPPDALPLRFGEPSFENHLASARRLNLPTTVLHLSGIGLDIDRPNDLLTFLATPRDTRTYRELTAWGVATRLKANKPA
ncbi:MAG: 2-phospho-L-lactate guanylyltransferase [Candidatus Rokubacteria bacterium]|nr:2-phospho-L-lactate guanylyltransferase [Candidatus Rokubacteria bacterium]